MKNKILATLLIVVVLITQSNSIAFGENEDDIPKVMNYHSAFADSDTLNTLYLELEDK